MVEVTDKKLNESCEVTISVGETASVGELEIAVEHFLPAFSYSGGNILSKSASPENPAARVVVNKGGKEVFSGWMFSKYPDSHPMRDERYIVVLKNGVASDQ